MEQNIRAALTISIRAVDDQGTCEGNSSDKVTGLA